MFTNFVARICEGSAAFALRAHREVAERAWLAECALVPAASSGKQLGPHGSSSMYSRWVVKRKGAFTARFQTYLANPFGASAFTVWFASH